MFFTIALVTAGAGGWTFNTEQFSLPAHASRTVVTPCPTGTLARAGGFQINGGVGVVIPQASFPNPNAQSWAVTAINTGPAAKSVEVVAYANCQSSTTVLAVPPAP